MIDRSYGIPFGRVRSRNDHLVVDAQDLHGLKWSLDIHEAVFRGDLITEAFIDQTINLHQRADVAIALSTGCGNVLQNLRSIAYIAGTPPFTVMGERLEENHLPYSCLVRYSGISGRGRVGVELLTFNEFGNCRQMDKRKFVDGDLQDPGEESRWGFERELRWAVSGYPLILDGAKTSLETLAYDVSDYRHLWRLVQLETSLMEPLRSLQPEAARIPRRLEFYFGADQIRRGGLRFVQATKGKKVVFQTIVPFSREWVDNMCNVSQIDKNALDELIRGGDYFELDQDKLSIDLKTHGYFEKKSSEDVTQPGDFYLSRDRQECEMILLPAVYPHHIIGIDKERKVVNITISGLSGRSGVTIDDAQDLCVRADLQDAIILDNGNDVVARIRGGDVICHPTNIRQSTQTRLTGAIHFGYLHAEGLAAGAVRGFEVADTIATAQPLVRARQPEEFPESTTIDVPVPSSEPSEDGQQNDTVQEFDR